MARIVDPNKANAVLALKRGEKVVLTNGQIATFEKAKRTKFLGEIDGTTYDIPFNMFVRKESDAAATTEKVELKEYECMSYNEYFYAKEGDKAILYIFEKNLGMNIVARNPITGKTTYVSVDDFAKRLKFKC